MLAQKASALGPAGVAVGGGATAAGAAGGGGIAGATKLIYMIALLGTQEGCGTPRNPMIGF